MNLMRISTNPKLNRTRLALAAVICMGGALGGCGGSKTTPTTPAATITSVNLTGTVALTAVGQTSQLIATAGLSDGSHQTVTSQASWQSSNPAVATVSSTGLVSSVGYGTATITATDQTVSGSSVVTIALNVAGTWTGTGSDSNGSRQFTSVALTQTGGTVSGTFNAVTAGVPISGTFSGTVGSSGATLSFSMSGSTNTGGGSCTLSFSGVGQVNNITFTAQYAANSSCVGDITNGQMTLTKQ